MKTTTPANLLIKKLGAALLLAGAALVATWSTSGASEPPRPVADAPCTVVGIPSRLTDKDSTLILKDTLTYVLQQAIPGETILVVDGVSLVPVVKFVIPASSRYANATARGAFFKAELAAYGAYLKNTRRATTNPPVDAILSVQLVELAATQLKPATAKRLRIIMIGSAIYQDITGDHASDMVGGFLPCDRFILTDRLRSIYGTLGKSNLLANTAIHWAYINDDKFISDQHKFGVTRFWSLWAQHQGGALVTFSASPAVAFQRAAEGVTAPLLESQMDLEKPGLYFIRHDPDRAYLVNTNKADLLHDNITLDIAHGTHGASVATNTPPTITNDAPQLDAILNSQAIPSTPLGDWGFAIAWTLKGASHLVVKNTDVDEWIWAEGHGWIGFNNSTNAVGRYFRDIKSTLSYSPADDQSVCAATWEYATISGSVPLDQLGMRLNLYAHDGSNALAGVVKIIAPDGTAKTADFTFPAGVKGNGMGQPKQPSPSSLVIDLKSILQQGRPSPRPAAAPASAALPVPPPVAAPATVPPAQPAAASNAVLLVSFDNTEPAALLAAGQIFVGASFLRDAGFARAAIGHETNNHYLASSYTSEPGGWAGTFCRGACTPPVERALKAARGLRFKYRTSAAIAALKLELKRPAAQIEAVISLPKTAGQWRVCYVPLTGFTAIADPQPIPPNSLEFHAVLINQRAAPAAAALDLDTIEIVTAN